MALSKTLANAVVAAFAAVTFAAHDAQAQRPIPKRPGAPQPAPAQAAPQQPAAPLTVVVFNPTEAELKAFAEKNPGRLDKAAGAATNAAGDAAAGAATQRTGRFGSLGGLRDKVAGAAGKAAGAVRDRMNGDEAKFAPAMMADAMKAPLDSGKLVLVLFGTEEQAARVKPVLETREFSSRVVLMIVDPANPVFKGNFADMIKGFGDVDAPQVATFKGSAEKPLAVTGRSDITPAKLREFFAAKLAAPAPTPD